MTTGPSIGSDFLSCSHAAADVLTPLQAARDSVLPVSMISGRNGEDMKKFWISKSPVIALALLSVPSLFAANIGSLHVSSPEEVAGQTLDAGDYRVRWEGHGPDVELKIMQGRKIMATATAYTLPLQRPSASDSVVVITNGQRRGLSQIFFSGKAVALEFRGPSAAVNISSK
jgi:hypothetical protein